MGNSDIDALALLAEEKAKIEHDAQLRAAATVIGDQMYRDLEDAVRPLGKTTRAPSDYLRVEEAIAGIVVEPDVRGGYTARYYVGNRGVTGSDKKYERSQLEDAVRYFVKILAETRK